MVCPGPSAAISGYRAVIAVGAKHLSYRGACDSEFSAIHPTKLSVSALGNIDIPTENPLISFGNGLFDRMDSIPTVVSTEKISSRTWCSGNAGAESYDIVIRAQGTVENPTGAKVLILGKRGILGSFDVFSSNGERERIYSGGSFNLSVKAFDRNLSGTLTVALSGAALQISSLIPLTSFTRSWDFLASFLYREASPII